MNTGKIPAAGLSVPENRKTNLAHRGRQATIEPSLCRDYNKAVNFDHKFRKLRKNLQKHKVY
jgi:hypothetical protein